MKKLITLILVIVLSTTFQAQDSLQINLSIAQRSGAFAPRILKQLGKNAYTAEITTGVKYKKYFFTSILSKDLNNIVGIGTENLLGNSLLLMAGKNISFGKWSVASRIGLFQPLGSDYFNPKIQKATLIPNVFVRYKVSQKSSLGLWMNYFSNFSQKGSAFIMRADYAQKFKDIGKLEILVNYNDGLFGKDRVINGGIHFSTTTHKVSERIVMHFDIYYYHNLVEFGDDPFTQNAFGIGLVFKKK